MRMCRASPGTCWRASWKAEERSSMLLLKNGALIDGTGSPERSGDVLISGERIAEVGTINPPAACRVIDCTGLTVAPGFIDGHCHSDIQVLENRPEKVAQGVTAEVVG